MEASNPLIQFNHSLNLVLFQILFQ